MLVSKAVTIFNVLNDKFGSPNVIESEIIDHFNFAISEYLNRLFPDNQGGVVNFELDSNVLMNLQPLIYPLNSLAVTSGVLLNSTINSALVTAAGAGSTYFRIMNVSYTNGGSTYYAKYAKHNNILAYERNTYKAPSATKVYYSPVAAGLKFYPSSTSTVSPTVVKNPKVLTTSDLSTSFEFSDYVVYNIIAIALKLSGIGTRDAELIDDVRMTGLQITQ